MQAAKHTEHLEFGGMVSSGARGRAHRGRSVACHAGQHVAGTLGKSSCGQTSARIWIFRPQLHPAVYESRHDQASGCIDFERTPRGTQILNPAGGTSFDNSPVTDQQSTIRNNTQIAQFRAAPRSFRAAKSNKLARAADQDCFGLGDTLELAG